MRLSEIAMHDAPFRVTFVEDAMTDRIAIEDRRRSRGKIGFDDEGIGRAGGGGDAQAAPYQGVAEGPIDREFHRYIPVSRTTRARVAAAVISVETEREHIL